MGLGFCLPDWPTSQLAGRHRCVIACDQAGQHAPLHRHASPKKELQTKVTLSLLIALTSLQAWLPSPKNTSQLPSFHQKIPHYVKEDIMMPLQGSHQCCTFAALLAFCPFETTSPHLSYCKDWTNHACPRALQHYWPYHWCEIIRLCFPKELG